MARINAVSFHEHADIEWICRTVLAAGFDSLEVSRPPFYEQLTTSDARRRFAEWAADVGLSLYGFDCWVDVSPYDRFRETLDEFQAAVDFAADLQLGMVISHDPWMRDNGDRTASECRQCNIELFRRVADLCNERGLRLVFEPHPDTLSMDNAWCIDFVDGIQRDNVGVLYDSCHYGVGQPHGYVDSIATLGARIKHVHYADGDAQTYALHLPFGDGVLDLPGVVSALKAIEYHGTLTNDVYNCPSLVESASRNAPLIRRLEAELGTT